MQQFHKILPLLSDDGFVYLSKIFSEHNFNIYAVGGSVRDCLLSDNTDISKIDIDLATPAPPQQMIDILEKNSIKYLTMGLEFGTITAIINHKHYEITSFRQDIQTNGRHAIVIYTDKMLADAQRRDFTINALYYDTQGIIYDPLGTGIADLNNQAIHFIGNPHNRISEDYLRILRYFRFLARFGMDSYDKSLFENHDYGENLNILSEHRIRNELKKMLSYPFISEVLKEIINLDYHTILFKNLILNYDIFCQFQKINPASEYLLASLLYQNDVKNIKKNDLLTKDDRKKINDFSKLYKTLQILYADNALAEMLELQYDYDMSLWHDLLSIIGNDNPNIKKIQNITLPVFTLTGKDILLQGIPHGKQIAILLKQSRTEFVQSFLKNIF